MYKRLLLIIALMLFGPPPADAQQPKKVHRIVFCRGDFPAGNGLQDPAAVPHAASRQSSESSAHSGYVEGKNITFEYRYAEDKPDRSAALADELVRLKVDVIIAGGSNDTRGAKTATRTIPIVFLESVSDPVALGFVESLARPGGNITGFTTMAAVLAGKRLELLKEAIPTLSRVAVLF